MAEAAIIIPVYNTKPNYIQEAINSALNQTLKDIEIIVVNDGSTNQETLKYLKELEKDNRLKIIHQENKGPSSARNTGIKEANSKYILPLDSDDKIDPTYIQKAIKVIKADDEIGMVYCEAKLFGTKNKKWELPEYNKEEFIFNNCIFCSALFKKELWQKVGGYNENMQSGIEDYDMWLSFIESGYKPYKIPEILFFYRQQATATMSTKANSNLLNIYKQIINNHPNLYLQSQEVINRIFNLPENTVYKTLKKKIKKYKFLFKIAICANIILLILIISIIILKG